VEPAACALAPTVGVESATAAMAEPPVSMSRRFVWSLIKGLGFRVALSVGNGLLGTGISN